MRINIDTELCAGCGLCEEIFPEVFMMGKYTAAPKIYQVPWESALELTQAVEDCPAEAIRLIPEKMMQNAE